MTPSEFKGQNIIFGANQPQYNPLPAHVDDTGVVTTCWEMTQEERQEFLETGKVYIQIMTFNKPLQPMYITTINPFDLLK